jgi:uncharacterized protein (DUF433 family)
VNKCFFLGAFSLFFYICQKLKTMEYTFFNFPSIVISQEVCAGKPRLKGTRIPVSSVLAYLAGGMSIDEFLKEFYWVERPAVLEALAFSAQTMNDRLIPLEKAA